MTQTIDRVHTVLPDWLETTLSALLAAGLAVLCAVVLHTVVFRILGRIAKRTDSATDEILIVQLHRPTRWALVALALVLVAREVDLVAEFWAKVAGFAMPLLVGWIALSIMRAFVQAMTVKADITVADNLRARRRRTRLTIFSRIASFLIVFVTIGLMLLSIPGVRDIGVTLMASAGLAGLAVGAAAQPALKSLIAGFQMAVTEPISIDDVVIIEGQWGRIEDITTTFVIVRTWDERRLVVPTTKFLEDTFENWTKESANLVGTVFLYLDPLADIAPLRAEFLAEVARQELWDRRVAALQVTETTADAIEVRLIMSSDSSGHTFDLRCHVREAMLAYIRQTQPTAIRQQRLLFDTPADGGRSTAIAEGETPRIDPGGAAGPG